MQRRGSVRYGPSAAQEADLHLPAGRRPPVVCLLHGGFWRMPYGRGQLSAVAEDLVAHGLAVWNLEYSRVGAGGGWPKTAEDVGAGIDYLGKLRDDGVDLDLDRVVVVGHSAGGHLALGEAGWRQRSKGRAERVGLLAVVGLAPIADLALAYDARLGGDAVAEFVGGSPRQHPELYRAASPAEMLPLGLRQLILHGTSDEAVPIDLSRRYVHAAIEAGDQADLVELVGAGHMDYLDSTSEAHAKVRESLLTLMSET
jgi:acetyl esterase/lipase